MHLFREIGLLPATFLVVGNIIGIGIFTTTGLIAAEIGNSPWLLGVWILGGFLALIGATCYSLLSIRIPQAGGESAFLYPSYGPLAPFSPGGLPFSSGFQDPSPPTRWL
jgi:APA family basic amino acid/polyamine antiporter